MTLTRALVGTCLICSMIALFRTIQVSNDRVMINVALGNSAIVRSDRKNDYSVAARDTFCHTDPGISIHTGKRFQKPDRNSCVGYCKANATISVRDVAVKAPKMLTLCLMNPFHGFYDCIWPLVHYLFVCRGDRPPVVIHTFSIPERRRQAWPVIARDTFLRHSGLVGDVVELGSLGEKECLCFRSLVRFDKQTLWRPTRFHYKQKLGNHSVLAPHPSILKRNALRLFRKSVERLSNGQVERREKSFQLLVYGRQDAPRRKWLNVNDFIRRISKRAPPEFNITEVHKIPKTFAEQVQLHQNAAMLVAPHGAAMVNTLVMREGSAVVDIASRHCIDLNQSGNTTNLDIAMDPTDPNTWLPWHSQSLELYHFTAPCYLPAVHDKGGSFVTDNDHLVNITLLATSFIRQAR